MKRIYSSIVFTLFLSLLLTSCGSKKAEVPSRPDFSCDTAYAYIEQQLNFGPRVPNGKGHTDCALYIIRCLRMAGADVTIQRGSMTDYSGREQTVMNIIGHFGEGAQRILLAAHYDTRPWTDSEPDYTNRNYCVPGANDGASGVGVLLEVARQLGLRDTIMQSVDLVFFDCEDMGTPSFYTGPQRDNTWCLGSQLWEQRYSGENYTFGVLLDMVGAPDAVFPREYYSTQFANDYVELIWRKAAELGHSRYFVNSISYPVTDDHIYVNRAGIPCVDIIHYDPQSATGFAEWWHTRNDDLSNISLETLQAVGEVIMSLL